MQEILLAIICLKYSQKQTLCQKKQTNLSTLGDKYSWGVILVPSGLLNDTSNKAASSPGSSWNKTGLIYNVALLYLEFFSVFLSSNFKTLNWIHFIKVKK